MACCSTITPSMNSSQKRSGGLFDLPKSAKKRRPFSSSNLSASSSTSSNSNKTMVTTMTSLSTSDRPVIVIDEKNNKESLFGSMNSNSTPNMFYLNNQTNTNDENNQTKAELMERIRNEAKRLIKRRQINLNDITPDVNSSSSYSNNSTLLNVNYNAFCSKSKLCSASTSSLNTCKSPTLSSNVISSSSSTTTSSLSSTSSKYNTLNHNDMPIFSMNQVNQICERLLKEREQTLREHYDKLLSQKLSEQYDAFVKFTHEQIQRKFESSQCSYVS